MIELKKLTQKDVTPFYKWINDKDVIRYSLSLFLKISTKDEIDNWYQNLITDDTIINYGIFLKATDQLIGYTGICAISKTNKSGEFYLFIGEKNLWGKGIGTQATQEILKIGFENYRLNRIFLTVSEYNLGGIKAYKKAGFTTEGILRQANFREGNYHDKILMSILKEEWERVTSYNL